MTWASSGFTRTNIPGTGTAIGTGKQNTALILSVDANAPAAEACAKYRGGDKDDWFLPSQNELALMYRNLKVNNTGGFANNFFWSSSQYSNNTSGAWSQNFVNGGQIPEFKYFEFNVRAIRFF